METTAHDVVNSILNAVTYKGTREIEERAAKTLEDYMVNHAVNTLRQTLEGAVTQEVRLEHAYPDPSGQLLDPERESRKRKQWVRFKHDGWHTAGVTLGTTFALTFSVKRFGLGFAAGQDCQDWFAVLMLGPLAAEWDLGGVFYFVP
jgi:hypothetical protein